MRERRREVCACRGTHGEDVVVDSELKLLVVAAHDELGVVHQVEREDQASYGQVRSRLSPSSLAQTGQERPVKTHVVHRRIEGVSALTDAGVDQLEGAHIFHRVVPAIPTDTCRHVFSGHVLGRRLAHCRTQNEFARCAQRAKGGPVAHCSHEYEGGDEAEEHHADERNVEVHAHSGEVDLCEAGEGSQHRHHHHGHPGRERHRPGRVLYRNHACAEGPDQRLRSMSSQSEVIWAILFEHSPCCGVGRLLREVGLSACQPLAPEKANLWGKRKANGGGGRRRDEREETKCCHHRNRDSSIHACSSAPLQRN